MNIALINDIHFGARGDSSYFQERYRLFFREVFIPKLVEHNVQAVLVLGDTWEHRRQINISSFNAAIDMFFAPLAELGMPVKIIYGNHDVYYRNTNSLNSIDFLGKMFDNVEVVSEPKVFEFGNQKIGMVSWINKENYLDSIKFIEEADCNILCGHFEIKGFDMMVGVPCEHGFSRDIFDRFDFVYSGHFHVMSTQGNITYTSNPFQTNWGDYGAKKGFRVMDTLTGELTLIENPFDNYDKIMYNDQDDLSTFPFQEYAGKIVRVYIESLSKLSNTKFSLFLDMLGGHAETVEVMETNPLELANVQISSETFDIGSMIQQYLDDSIKEEPHFEQVKSTFWDLYHETLKVVRE